MNKPTPPDINREIAIASIINGIQFRYYQRGEETEWAVGVDEEAIKEIKQLISQAQIEARIDELEKFKLNKYTFDPEVLGWQIKDRIEALKSQGGASHGK